MAENTETEYLKLIKNADDESILKGNQNFNNNFEAIDTKIEAIDTSVQQTEAGINETREALTALNDALDLIAVESSTHIAETGAVHGAVTTATANTIALRDVSGGLAAARFTGALTGAVTGNSSTATTLQTARTFQTNLSATAAASFNGSANNSHGVTGILAVGNGGTGNNTGKATADFYTGSVNLNAVYPIGSYLLCYPAPSLVLSRNQVCYIAIEPDTARLYQFSAFPTNVAITNYVMVTGVWRQRGIPYGSNSLLVQRVS